MDRRRAKRWPRQLDVRIWRQGDEESFPAVATNISRTGAFIRTLQVVPSGTRLRIEVRHAARGFVVEVVVARALRTPSQLQSVMPSGMGVRFLAAEELVEELFPGVLSTSREEAASSATATAQDAVPEQPAASSTPSEAASPPEPSVRVFRIGYQSCDQFRRVFERDILTGGLFVPATAPPALDQVVEIEVSVDQSATPPVRFEARVVHRSEAPPGTGAEGSLLAGMGVQFTDVAGAIERLRSLLGA
jgi:hypothetical protein